MTQDQPKPTPTDQVQEAAKTERHPEVPDHALNEETLLFPAATVLTPQSRKTQPSLA